MMILTLQLKYPEYYSTSYSTDSYCVKLQQPKIKAWMCIIFFSYKDFIFLIYVSCLMAD